VFEFFDIIIVGGGAAGLMCAAKIDEGRSVAVLEKTKNIGTKLLISGSGQCNLTHSGDVNSFLSCYGDNGRFLKKALYSFPNSKVIEFFEEKGVPMLERDDGKIFPKSLKSLDILNVLKHEITKKGHKIIPDCGVKSVVFDNESKHFMLQTVKGEFSCSKLVIAAGGSSYPQTGSSGDGYKLSRSLGHSVAAMTASLVPLKVENWPFASVSGNSFKSAALILKRGDKKLVRTGELLITHTGVSGPLVLDFSRYLNDIGSVGINFCSEYNNESMVEHITNLLRENPSSKVGNTLFKIGIPLNFSHIIMSLAKVDVNTLCAEISKKQTRAVSELICSYNAEFIKESMHVAMATAGGVELFQVNSLTMESKLIKGLFFCGEVLNIDGDTGGYNIQAAFSTGFCAAKAINSVS
jgi:hypothetical protein